MTDLELMHAHDQGAPMQQLAADLGLSTATVSKRIRRATPPRDELLDALERWGVAGCAEEYEVSERTVKQWRSMYAPRRLEMWIYDIGGLLWCEHRRLPSGKVTLVPCDQYGEPTDEGFVRVVEGEQLRTLKRALIKNNVNRK